MAVDNPRAARVSVYGDWGSAEDIIYENWEEADFDIPALKAREDLKFAFGLDFGFKVSYNALIAIAYDTLTRTLWIYDEMYFKGESNLVIAKEIIRKGYGKEKIWADSAEPKSIHELKEGFIEERMNPDGSKDHVRYALPGVVEAVKGPDSVRNGIARVQEYHIYIHYTCRNTLREVMNYSWKKDKDGKYTGEPEKEFDHLCLVGDTLIKTSDGEKRLDEIEVGDLVRTHMGLKPVTFSGMTNRDQPIWRVTTSRGILEGTWNHQVVTLKGIKYLKDLTDEDTLIAPGGGLQLNAFSGRLAPVEAFRHIGSDEDDGFVSRSDYVALADMAQYVKVKSVEQTDRSEDVYDITVEDAHDFFANGILVLNCDALRYALTGELIRGHGGVVEARGGTDAELLPERKGAPALPRPSRVSAPRPEAPVNTYADSEVVSAEGPADVAPPKKRTCRVFSSIRTE